MVAVLCVHKQCADEKDAQDAAEGCKYVATEAGAVGVVTLTTAPLITVPAPPAPRPLETVLALFVTDTVALPAAQAIVAGFVFLHFCSAVDHAVDRLLGLDVEIGKQGAAVSRVVVTHFQRHFGSLDLQTPS